MTTFFAGDELTAAALNAVTDTPLCQLFQTSTQSIPDNVTTALTFTGTEDIDTHNFHDPVTNPERITPTVPGYYRVTASYGTPTATTITTVLLNIAKNGTAVKAARRPYTSTSEPTSTRTLETEIILTANGTTDYFSATALQDNTANTAQSSGSGTTASSLSAEWLRPL